MNITDIDSVTKCAVRCLQDAKCYTMNYESETELCCLGGADCNGIEYAPGFEMLMVGQEVMEGESCVSWPQLGAEDVASTVQYEGQDGLEEVVRVYMDDGQVLPGHRSISGTTAYVAHDGQPAHSTTYETLVVHPTCLVTWQMYDGNVIPENAAIGGNRKDVALYVARTAVYSAGQLAHYGGGYLNPNLKEMFYVMYGTDKKTRDDIEILIVI